MNVISKPSCLLFLFIMHLSKFILISRFLCASPLKVSWWEGVEILSFRSGMEQSAITEDVEQCPCSRSLPSSSFWVWRLVG
ncbi:hypothetical protein RJT34_18318 [Clitoria ternatea]|uniref:Uncharacterized protein n=1 Tax=Clitoria ternatea TaxID=43366 RepID=A0AAN9JC34_CLITE